MTQVRCPECEAQNPVSEAICIQCGFPLETPEVQPAVGDPVKSCEGCGKTLQEGMRFCDGCGQPIAGQAPLPTPAGKPASAVPSIPGSDNPPAGTSSAGQAQAGDAFVPPIPDDGGPANSADTPPAAAEPEPQKALLDVQPASSTEGPQVQASPDSSGQTLSPGQQELFLKVVEGFSPGKCYMLYKTQMLLGRMDEDEEIYPDIDLEDQDDGYVSRRHALLSRDGGRMLLRDLGGGNGTSLDQRPVPPQKEVPVEIGQVIRVGKVGLMVCAQERS